MLGKMTDSGNVGARNTLSVYQIPAKYRLTACTSHNESCRQGSTGNSVQAEKPLKNSVQAEKPLKNSVRADNRRPRKVIDILTEIELKEYENNFTDKGLVEAYQLMKDSFCIEQLDLPDSGERERINDKIQGLPMEAFDNGFRTGPYHKYGPVRNPLSNVIAARV
ncbi:hypothetical protein Bbelb_142430 [Branchiostoma belcheri]|nr:hypothetical protein Bbelb_142430 [Branchiostoma belcheri]